MQERLVDVVFELGLAATARSVIRCDHDFGLAAIDARAEGIRGKARKDDRVDRADACAGEHGVGRFWNHRHVDYDAVALADTHVLENICHFANVAV